MNKLYQIIFKILKCKLKIQTRQNLFWHMTLKFDLDLCKTDLGLAGNTLLRFIEYVYQIIQNPSMQTEEGLFWHLTPKTWSETCRQHTVQSWWTVYQIILNSFNANRRCRLDKVYHRPDKRGLDLMTDLGVLHTTYCLFIVNMYIE